MKKYPTATNNNLVSSRRSRVESSRLNWIILESTLIHICILDKSTTDIATFTMYEYDTPIRFSTLRNSCCITQIKITVNTTDWFIKIHFKHRNLRPWYSLYNGQLTINLKHETKQRKHTVSEWTLGYGVGLAHFSFHLALTISRGSLRLKSYFKLYNLNSYKKAQPICSTISTLMKKERKKNQRTLKLKETFKDIVKKIAQNSILV